MKLLTVLWSLSCAVILAQAPGQKPPPPPPTDTVAPAIAGVAAAGKDKKTLYIVGRGSAFKVDLLAAGFRGRAK